MLQPDEMAKLVQRHRLNKVFGGERIVVVGKPAVIDVVSDIESIAARAWTP